MIISIIMLVISFIILIKGADIFVDGASELAYNFNVPAMFVGLTIVAFGTSAPELAVSLSASLEHSSNLALGNVVGSNIFNLLMVVGIGAIITPLAVEKSVLLKELPLTLFSTLLLFLVSVDLKVNMADGFILLLGFSVFLYYVIGLAIKSSKEEQSEVIIESHHMSKMKSAILTLVGIAMVVIGGKLVVKYASDIAKALGLSETLIGLTIVAIGTSLPELITSVVAGIKGEQDIALGNVVGSNIFNSLFIIGLSAISSPLTSEFNLIYDQIFLIFVTLLTYFYSFYKRKIGKAKGFSMVALYIAYTVYLIMRH